MLEGPASGGVRGLPLTAENYESAESILKKRFVQPQVIINAHMEGLVKVSAVRVDNVWDVYAFLMIELKYTFGLYKP